MLRIDSGHDDVVERCIGAGLQCNDERPAFGEMLLEIGGRSFKGEGAEAALLKVALHVGGADAADVRRIESLLNLA